ERLPFEPMRAPFERTFMAVWRGEAENDRFNRLVLELGVNWREAALVRALARYRGQSGLDPSPAIQEAAVATHPQIAALFLRLFAARFDPASEATLRERAATARGLEEAIDAA